MNGSPSPDCKPDRPRGLCGADIQRGSRIFPGGSRVKKPGPGFEKSPSRPFFRYADIALPTVLATAYSLAAYIVGLYLLNTFNLWFPVGVLLLAHGMTIAAFLLHECVHGSLFARQSIGGVEPHRALAVLLSWLTGSGYSDFTTLRNKHLRHHFERADIVALDHRQLLREHPVLRRVIEAAQWLCVPALDRERFTPDYFSREYEQRHTFSNLLSRRWPGLNGLVLNFCYHNAHHYRPAAPWCHLPVLHRQLLASYPPPVEIPFACQLRDFFRYRVIRVMAAVTDDLARGMGPGAAGVSFLTPL